MAVICLGLFHGGFATREFECHVVVRVAGYVGQRLPYPTASIPESRHHGVVGKRCDIIQAWEWVTFCFCQIQRIIDILTLVSVEHFLVHFVH